MSVPTQEKTLQRDNPFLKVQAQPFPQQPARAMHAHARPTTHRHNPTPTITINTGNPHSATQQWQKKQQTLKLKAVAGLLLTSIVIFSFLPARFQQKAFKMVGLGSIQSQTLFSVPLPVDYDYVSSPFGRRWGRQHQGIDLAAQTGAPIYAASSGTVLHSGWERGYGKSVVIDHGEGMHTRYGHCSQVLIKPGVSVVKGQLIAQVGSTGHSTGPHLHFEVIVKGVRKNPAWYYQFDKTPHWYALKVKEGKNWLQAFSEKLNRWAAKS